MGRRTPNERARSHSRRGFAALAGCLALACSDPLPVTQRVVLVTIDTLRADRLGCYGDERARTPTLDALAAAGVRFEHAVAPTPITLPSHASLFTGLDPHQHGVRVNGRFELAPEIPTVAEGMKAAGLATAAFVSAFVLDARFGLTRGFDVYDDAIGHERASEGAFSPAERRGDATVDAALAWLRSAPDAFFLWIHLYDPHADYRPPPEYLALAGGDAYAGEIAFADAQLRRVIQEVQRRFGPDGTLLAVTSDHGEALGDHGEKTHTLGIYDATQRVPLLLVGPGIPRGRTVREPVRLIDLGPTLLARAGAPPLDGARGQDLSDLVWGHGSSPPAAYLETLETQLGMGWSPLLGIRTPTEKYVRAPKPELYDLTADPRELVNLAAERPDRVRELDASLGRLAEDARAPTAAPGLGETERQQLVALGYLSADAAALPAELGVVAGPNPRDHIHEVAQLLHAAGLVGQGRGVVALATLEPVQIRGLYFHRLRGVAALQADRPELALESAEHLIAGGLPGEGLWLRGMAALAQDDPVRARRDLEAAHALTPLDTQALLGLGLVAEGEGDFEGAARHYEEAARVGRDAPGARLHLAALRLRQGRVEEADEILADQAFAIRTDPTTILRLAATEREAGRPERADRWLDEGLAADPHSVVFLEARAAAHDAAGEFDRALALRRRLYALSPDEPERVNGLAWAMALAGQELDDALVLARRAVAGFDPPHAALDTLATVHLARGEAQAALEAAERGLDGAPAPLRPHLLYLRAVALAELGRTGDARAALRALDAEPERLGAPWDARAAELGRRLAGRG